MRKLFAGETVNFENEFFKVVNLKLEPTPLNISICIAAHGPQMLKLVEDVVMVLINYHLYISFSHKSLARMIFLHRPVVPFGEL